MLSTRRHSTSILTRKEILEKGFLARSSRHSHSFPVLSYYMDSSSASKWDTWELPMDVDNTASGSSLCVVKQVESLSSCVKAEPHSLTQSISDLGLICFCKAHHGQATFELSGLPWEHPSRDGHLMNVVSQKTSTPCKPLQSLLFKSSELAGDLSALGKVPTPRWDISTVKSFMDTSTSFDVSTEESRSLGCSKPATSILETPVVIPWCLQEAPYTDPQHCHPAEPAE